MTGYDIMGGDHYFFPKNHGLFKFTFCKVNQIKMIAHYIHYIFSKIVVFTDFEGMGMPSLLKKL